jgi:hypothetical protein
MHIAVLQKKTRMLVRLNAPDILFGKYLSWIEDFSQGCLFLIQIIFCEIKQTTIRCQIIARLL